MEKTVFQKVIDRELPATTKYEDDRFIIIDSIEPRATIHVLVIPKEPVRSIVEAVEKSPELIGSLFTCAISYLKEHNIKDFKLVLNGGAQLHVPHLHLHILGGKMGGGDHD